MPRNPATRQVAIVEDDVSVLNALAFALEADGYEVIPYLTGAAALERPPRSDCLVIDLRLPDMDGLSLISQLRTLGPQPPVILITTNPDERCRRLAAQIGVSIVEKPLISADLRDRIAEVIAANPVSRHPRDEGHPDELR